MARDEQDDARQTAYPAESAWQGRIVLRAPWQRWVFAGALVLLVALALLSHFLR